MNTRRRFEALLFLALALNTIVPGCGDPSRALVESPRLSSKLARNKTASTSPSRDLAAQLADEKDIAVVNGQAISSQVFLDTLIEARGLPLLQQLLFLEAVRAAAEEKGISLTPRLVEREYDLTLADVTDGDATRLTQEKRDALIDAWCARRQIPRAELYIAMQRQALLRQLAQRNVRVTGAMVEDEFNRAYGRKVEVRHLQIPARRTTRASRAALRVVSPLSISFTNTASTPFQRPAAVCSHRSPRMTKPYRRGLLKSPFL